MINKSTVRWFAITAVAAILIFFLPPQGLFNGKFLAALLSGVGVGASGLWQLSILKRYPTQPLRAVAIGAISRTAVVIVGIIIVYFVLPGDQLAGTAISIVVIYFAVQMAEMPLLLKSLNEQKP